MPPASVPEAASRTTRRAFRCTIAAAGWAIRDPFGELAAGCRKLGMDVVARTDPHATYQDVYDAHPDWIAVDASGETAPPLGLAGDVGHLRARTVQLRVHDRGHAGDRRRATRWTASSATAGTARACATASTARRISSRPPASICPARRIRRIPPAGPISSGGRSACSSSGGFGTRRSARSIPTPRSSPMPAAAR